MYINMYTYLYICGWYGQEVNQAKNMCIILYLQIFFCTCRLYHYCVLYRRHIIRALIYCSGRLPEHGSFLYAFLMPLYGFSCHFYECFHHFCRNKLSESPRQKEMKKISCCNYLRMWHGNLPLLKQFPGVTTPPTGVLTTKAMTFQKQPGGPHGCVDVSAYCFPTKRGVCHYHV